MPFNAKTGLPNARGTLPEKPVSFDEALAACVKYNGKGVGRRFTEHDDIGFVDIDHCFDPESGEPSEWAL
jgi:primase-polymerase (primpol)-like protein